MPIKQRFITSVLIILLVATPVFQTHAFVGALLAGGAGLIGSVVGESIISQTISTGVETLKLSIKRRALDTIVNNIIDWIEGGGEPKFISDWQGFLRDTANAAIGDAILSTDYAFLCAPFGIQVQIALERPPRFGQLITCTLDDVVQNIEGFYQDFRSGGFIAYSEVWQPQNNFYGSILMALQERDRASYRATSAGILEGLAGSGFLGSRSCQTYGGRTYCRITTPGATIGATLAKAVGSDIDFIVNSEEELAAYLAAISDALINRLIREGSEGLLGVSGTAPSQPPIDYGPCDGLVGPALNECLKINRVQLGGVNVLKDNYIQQINDTLVPLARAENNIVAMLNSQTRLLDRLNEWESCLAVKGQPTNIPAGEKQNITPTLLQLEADLNNVQPAVTGLENAAALIANGGVNKNPQTGNLVIADAFFEIEHLLDPQSATALEIQTSQSANILISQANRRAVEVQREVASCSAIR